MNALTLLVGWVIENLTTNKLKFQTPDVYFVKESDFFLLKINIMQCFGSTCAKINMQGMLVFVLGV